MPTERSGGWIGVKSERSDRRQRHVSRARRAPGLTSGLDAICKLVLAPRLRQGRHARSGGRGVVRISEEAERAGPRRRALSHIGCAPNPISPEGGVPMVSAQSRPQGHPARSRS
eukprot:6195920-Pleurochrysis_carterae.AAC.2